MAVVLVQPLTPTLDLSEDFDVGWRIRPLTDPAPCRTQGAAVGGVTDLGQTAARRLRPFLKAF